MRRRISSLFIVSCLFANLAQCGDVKTGKTEASFPDAIEEMPADKVKVVLYSLLPFEKPQNGSWDAFKEDFHGFTVLGKKEITSSKEKKDLLTALAKGVREGGPHGLARCFNPRHGLRIIDKTEEIDFVICFECGQVRASNFKGGNSAGITKSQETVFDRYLDEYHLPKAK